jgi:hypothetical protein
MYGYGSEEATRIMGIRPSTVRDPGSTPIYT